jgi:Flp pilus assembly protein TadG
MIRRRHSANNGPRTLFRRGAAAVEMAVVLPVFITLILGMIELGRGIMVAQLMVNAAREAARAGVIDGSSNSSVSSVATSFLQNAANINPGSVTVTITTSGGGDVSSAKAQDLITVNLSVPFSDVSWLPPKYLAGMNLTAMSAMRHE